MNDALHKTGCFFSDPQERKMRQQPGLDLTPDGQTDIAIVCPSLTRRYLNFILIALPGEIFLYALIVYIVEALIAGRLK